MIWYLYAVTVEWLVNLGLLFSMRTVTVGHRGGRFTKTPDKHFIPSGEASLFKCWVVWSEGVLQAA